MVGQLGEDAAASVSVTTTVSWLISSIPSAISVAVLAMIAKAIGSDDSEKIRDISRHTALTVPVIGVFLGAVSVGLRPFIPTWMGAEIAIRKQASIYFFKNPDLQTGHRHGIIEGKERHIKPCQKVQNRTEVNPEEQHRGINRYIGHQYRGLSKCIIKLDTKNDISRLMKQVKLR